MRCVGIRAVLMGQQGSGKTSSIRTLLKCGLDVRAIFTEANSLVVLADVLDKLRYAYIPPYGGMGARKWAVLESVLNTVNTASNKVLQDMPKVEPTAHRQAIELIKQLAAFKTATGDNLGSVDSWGTDCVLVIDSLTGLNKMFATLNVGAKPIRSQPDWGVAMDNLHRLVDMIATETSCHIIVMAHVEMLTDELTRDDAKLMPHTIGRKLAPVLFSEFGDIILAEKRGADFYWSTANPRAALKNVHLPLSDKLSPTWEPVIAEWRRRNHQALNQTNKP